MTTCKNTEGRKNDENKPDFSLLHPPAIIYLVKVLTFGAKKYGADNWKVVPNMKKRYFAATQRHLWAWYGGENTDDESGMPHLAHALASLFILFSFCLLESEDK